MHRDRGKKPHPKKEQQDLALLGHAAQSSWRCLGASGGLLVLQAGGSVWRGHKQQDLEEGNAGVLPAGDHFFLMLKALLWKEAGKGQGGEGKKKKSDLKLN